MIKVPIMSQVSAVPAVLKMSMVYIVPGPFVVYAGCLSCKM